MMKIALVFSAAFVLFFETVTAQTNSFSFQPCSTVVGRVDTLQLLFSATEWVSGAELEISFDSSKVEVLQVLPREAANTFGLFRLDSQIVKRQDPSFVRLRFSSLYQAGVKGSGAFACLLFVLKDANGAMLTFSSSSVVWSMSEPVKRRLSFRFLPIWILSRPLI